MRAAGRQEGVADAQADQLGETQAGLERELQERVVAAAEPASAVGGGQQRFDLFRAELGEAVLPVAFGRDREHARDRGGLLGVHESRVAVEGVDRGQAGVAAGAVAALAFEVLEEGADQRRVEVGELELAGLLAGLRLLNVSR